MGEMTKIEWAHHTFNPWIGCAKVSAACAHCYAEHQPPVRVARAAGRELWGANAERQVASESSWRQPLAWNRAAVKAGERRRVFCASLADVFEDRPELIAPRSRLLQLIAETPNLDWLLLTKRPENIFRLLESSVANRPWVRDWINGSPPANVWLGTTVETQEQADKRIPELLKVPARVRFLSCEPLLGPVALSNVNFGSKVVTDVHDVLFPQHGPRYPGNGNPLPQLPGGSIDWVIAGGESGPGARPMHPDWARSLRDQCQAAGVPFFFKQWGEWLPGEAEIGKTAYLRCDTGERYATSQNRQRQNFNTHPDCNSGSMITLRVGKKAAGRLLDGREWNEMPEV